ncbi:MAG: hypothetical protein HY303_05560 [Candidatus Wallbacteria bacterium]|nr:hypothetical protein [Candidatus Wallbacteria bacterium]
MSKSNYMTALLAVLLFVRSPAGATEPSATAKAAPVSSIGGVAFEESASAALRVEEELQDRSEEEEGRPHLLFGSDASPQSPVPEFLSTSDALEVYVLAENSRKREYRIVVEETAGGKSFEAPTTSLAASVDAWRSTSRQSLPDLVLLARVAGPFHRGSVRVTVEAPLSPPAVRQPRQSVVIPVRAPAHYSVRPALLGSDLQPRSYVIRGGMLDSRYASNPLNGAVALTWFHSADGLPKKTTPRRWLDRFNPMLGIPLDRFGKRWYFGLSVMVAPGLDLEAGLQFEQIDRLAVNAPLFFNSDGSIGVRTTNGWDSAPFIGFAVDAELAVDKLKSFFSGDDRQ